MAAYSFALVALLGGGDDEGGSTTQAEKPPPLSPAERKVAGIIQSTKIAGDTGDVNRFRQPVLKSIKCDDKGFCDVVYSIGLTGQGRILQDQRDILARVFSDTDVQRIDILVTRDAAAAGVPAKAEDTPSGTPLTKTSCDRSRRDNVDWTSAKGEQILFNLCKVGGYEHGRQQRQDPVAPDDPAVGGAQNLPGAGE